MSGNKRFCEQNFKIWLAFMMGMVIVVVAIVFFDRALGVGRPSETPHPVESGYGSEPSAQNQPVSYLALQGGKSASGAWLGIEATDISAATAEKLGYEISTGILVSRIVPGSPAESAGLRIGDIIYEYDYQSVDSVADFSSQLSKTSPDTRVKLALLRDGEREVVYVVLGEMDAAARAIHSIAGQAVPQDQKWGIVVSELSDSLRRAYGIPREQQGVLVVKVIPGTAADKAGLGSGDVIQQMDRTQVLGLADFFEALESSGNHILLKVYRDGAVRFVHIVAASPFMPVGGNSSEDDDGLKGRPAQIPPMGKPEPSTVEKVQGV
ncbi:MAG: PDZ domain-containing protein [Deltaproteobacteria bacterium]|nr:PDZ domain-containing protein [Deltaproteobacteria bacterium]